VIASNDHKATAKGVLLCRNTHLCPRCAQWLAKQRIDALRPQIEDLGGVNILVTLTVLRDLKRTLADQNSVLDGAWRMTNSGAVHRRWQAQAGGFSFIRGFETGYSFNSGWGGHFHAFVALHDPRWPTLEELGKDINVDRKRRGLAQLRGAVGRLELENHARNLLASIQDRHAGPADYLMEVFIRRFRENVEAQGGSFRASRGAQDWQYAKSFASVAYTGKGSAGWDALAEAVGGTFKKSGLLSVWDLAMMAHEGDQRAFALVNEYAEAMKGRRMLTVSRNLKLREDSELEPGETDADGVIDITDAGLKVLNGSDGLGLARLLDLMPRIWNDREAIILALGQEGLGLDPSMWAWHTKDPPPADWTVPRTTD